MHEELFPDLERFLVKYRNKMVNDLAQQVGCHEAAEDLFQEVMLKALPIWRQRPAQFYHVQGWVRLMLHWEMVNWQKKKAREACDGRLNKNDIAYLEAEFADVVRFRDQLWLLEYSLALLSEEDRQIIELIYFHDYTYAMIADHNGCDLVGAKVQVNRARYHLKIKARGIGAG